MATATLMERIEQDPDPIDGAVNKKLGIHW